MPTDKADVLKTNMEKRKQGDKESVIQYITAKRLLCMDMNHNMQYAEMKRYIINGMNKKIKKTITHMDNPDINALQTNAKNIELELEDEESDEEKIKSIIIETMKEKEEREQRQRSRERRFERKSRDRSSDEWGRRIVRRNSDEYRRNYSNMARSTSRERDASGPNNERGRGGYERRQVSGEHEDYRSEQSNHYRYPSPIYGRDNRRRSPRFEQRDRPDNYRSSYSPRTYRRERPGSIERQYQNRDQDFQTQRRRQYNNYDSGDEIK